MCHLNENCLEGMRLSNIKDKIKSIVAGNAVPELDPENITKDLSFVDMGYDSLQFIKLIVDIEECLDIFVEDEMLDPKLFENYGGFEKMITNIALTGEEV